MPTGLRRPDVMENVLNAVMRIEKAWLKSNSVNERVELLKECVFAGLREIDLPLMNVGTESAGPGIAARYVMGFDLTAFQILINDQASAWTGAAEYPELDLRECLDTFYHETRHHEQNLRILERYIWDTQSSFMTQKQAYFKQAALQTPLAKIIEEGFHLPPNLGLGAYFQKRSNMKYTGEEKVEQDRWYEERMGSYEREKKQVMAEYASVRRGQTTYNGYYAIYRTLFTEDDGFLAGVTAGNLYLKRSLEAKKGGLEEVTKLLQARKQALAAPRPAGANVKDEKAASTLAKQGEARASAELVEFRTAVEKLNGHRKAYGEKEQKFKEVMKSHLDDFTTFRVRAHEVRNKLGRPAYGTAAPATKKS